MRNVNVPIILHSSSSSASFILTMRNVNLALQNRVKDLDESFILTMRNVNKFDIDFKKAGLAGFYINYEECKLGFRTFYSIFK